MKLQIVKSGLKELLPLRELFLQENNVQIRYDACHRRGWADSYLILLDGAAIGYGSVKGAERLTDRDTVFEFHIIPPFRQCTTAAFPELLLASGAAFIESQSNVPLLTSLLYQFGRNIRSDVILFEDGATTFHHVPGAVFRRRKDDDGVFPEESEPASEYVLELDHEIVAAGGFLLHYNPPFADIHIEVREPYRGKGLGSYLVQELKKQCYLSGRVPAARCRAENSASKACLLKAGFRIAGHMLLGNVKDETLQPIGPLLQ